MTDPIVLFLRETDSIVWRCPVEKAPDFARGLKATYPEAHILILKPEINEGGYAVALVSKRDDESKIWTLNSMATAAAFGRGVGALRDKTVDQVYVFDLILNYDESVTRKRDHSPSRKPNHRPATTNVLGKTVRIFDIATDATSACGFCKSKLVVCVDAAPNFYMCGECRESFILRRN